MLTIAENSREGVYKEYVSAKIDISNIVMCIRSMRMEKPLSFFKSVFINGGSLDIGYFEEIYGEDTEKFFAAVSKTRYGKAFSLDITAGNPFGMDRAAAKYARIFKRAFKLGVWRRRCNGIHPRLRKRDKEYKNNIFRQKSGHFSAQNLRKDKLCIKSAL